MAYQKRPIRRSQLISPWGVGAIVPFPNNESLMIAGLDVWRYDDPKPYEIDDHRLLKRLNISKILLPPDFRDRKNSEKNYHLKIPAVKFPLWHYCPFCGSMKKLDYYTNDAYCDQIDWWRTKNSRSCANNKYKYAKKLIPERFVIACPEGHIEDFPIAEWLHAESDVPYNPETCHIRRSTGGTSAALSNVRYECSCGAKRSIAGAVRPGALEKIGFKCHSSKPWLGIENDEKDPCSNDQAFRVVQRGGTNVWFADVISSIFIPRPNEKLKSVLDRLLPEISTSRIDGELNLHLIHYMAKSEGLNYDELLAVIYERLNDDDASSSNESEISEEEYRYAEYKKLRTTSGSDDQQFLSRRINIENYHDSIQKYFMGISLISKLREARAFIGFSRLEHNAEHSLSYKKRMLRRGPDDWLPGLVVYGEGLFFEFNKETLQRWANQDSVKSRIASMSESYKQSRFGRYTDGELNPIYVMVHTFAHLLINRLSYQCGYGSSAIRERIYCGIESNQLEMYGLLIYTASGDSEGSLGGLVRQGSPGQIEETIFAAIENAKWCSSDPVCIESSGQGPDSANLAACHNCALLPETCCEIGNRFLDRGLIVGTIENPDIGYFT